MLLLILNLTSILVIRYFFRGEAVHNAEEKAKIILDRNLSIHDYFSTDLKPNLFETLNDSKISGDYFDPSWMSSSHAVIKINNYFQKRNDYGYYYKDATLDARNPRNEADSLELTYLQKVKDNPELPPEDGILNLEGVRYYYLLEKGEIMVNSCLQCHDTPDVAPQGLINIYGNERSFNRKVGDVISIVSIRIPIEQTYIRAKQNTIIVSVIISIAFVLSFMVFLYFQNKWIIRPIKSLSRESILISKDNSLIGKKIKVTATKDISDFTESFNIMSEKLHNHQLSLEEKIQEKTRDLEDKVSEVSEMNKTKDKFFSIISHDLKGPFNSLIGFSELLNDEIETGETKNIQSAADQIHKASQHAYNLLSDLLVWSQSQTGRISFIPELISPYELVNKIVALIEPECIKKNISIINEIEDSLALTADKNLLDTIIRNLVSNSVKYTHDGQIVISARSVNNTVEISVTDTGCGISPEKLKQLFLTDSTTSTVGTNNEKGTGLGLILCKEFVEMHKGKITVSSELGKGSKFCFTVPQ